MLLRGSSTRGGRGQQQQQNRPRGSRGRGSTSRGASNSSGSSSTGDSPNSFEDERRENAAKREQKGQNPTIANTRGRRGASKTMLGKQVRFADEPGENQQDSFPKSSSLAPPNPFATAMTPNSSFGSTTSSSFGSFTAKKDPPANPFGTPSTGNNAFGAPSQPPSFPPSKSIFGVSSQPQASSQGANPFGKSSINVFGMPSKNSSDKSSINPFEKSSTSVFGTPSTASSDTITGPPSQTNGSLGSSASSKSPFPKPSSNPFGAPSNGISSNFQKAPFGTPQSMNSFGGAFPKPITNGLGLAQPVSTQKPERTTPTATSDNSKAPNSALGIKIDQLLRRQGLNPPLWPKTSPSDENFRGLIEGYWRALRDYRVKVRACLIRAGIIDDPDKPKKLSEAIDFKGTCEDMCPEFEKATRVFERDVKSAEMDTGPDGKLIPVPSKMVKALARSSAGQDAPLPMDVRSPGSLRRTLDYLFRSVLGDDDKNLPRVHHFLWDRTRAIRRDFVFQSALSRNELLDQVYCLEHITRFHAISLHQMSKKGVVPVEDFSEHQEAEQLGKALLSLVHAYEDCRAQNIECENEAEFRSYYILLNRQGPGISNTVQDWGWKFWGESDHIRTAVTLVDSLENIWDRHGPLKPYSAMDTAQNGYARFLSVVRDRKVSYTMACFAEIQFNSVRKSILKTILASYRKQRDQTKDWTLTKLNEYLRFDDEADIVPFGEAYGLRFDEVDNEVYLSFESEVISDPHPRLKQPYSYDLVERKRGNHSLPDVIGSAVYDEAEDEEIFHKDTVATHDVEDDGGLFVKDNTMQGAKPSIHSPFLPESESSSEQEADATPELSEISPLVKEGTTKPASQFDRISSPNPAGLGPSIPNAAEQFSFSQIVNTPASNLLPFAASAKPIFGEKSEGPSPFLKQPGEKLPESFSVFGKPPENPLTSLQTPGIPPAPKQGNFASIFAKKPIDEMVPSSEESPATTPPTTQPKPLFNFAAQTSSQTLTSGSNGPASLLGVFPATSGPSDSPKKSVSTPAPTPASPKHADRPNEQTPQAESAFSNNIAPSPAPSLALAAQSVPQQTPDQFLRDSHHPKHTHTLFEARQTPTLDREVRVTKFSEWAALGDGGIVDQFTSFVVESILRGVADQFSREESKRVAEEELALVNQQADGFRHRSLGTKYFHMWRENAHRLWVKRKGREARKTRQELAEGLRASKMAQSANVVEDFRSSTSAHRRGSLESLLNATGILNGVHDPAKQVQAIIYGGEPTNTRKRHRAQTTMIDYAQNEGGHKRGKSDNPLRRSLLSDPSYLSGSSRIHLMPKYDVQDETRRQVSGVQTDYFRLKARGITTLPNGTPLASSAVKGILHQKKSFDGVTKPTTPHKLHRPSPPRSAPSKATVELDSYETNDPRDDHIYALKQRAQAVLSEDDRTRNKRSFDGSDDEALFERAKRIREQMDEGVQWYREEIERRSGSRSVS